MTARPPETGGTGIDLDEAARDLQMRVTYQEDEIKHLNRTVARQQAELDALRKQLAQLRDLVAAVASESGTARELEVPPHY